MNDIVTSAELFGKVVVVTDLKGLPSACVRCPYFRAFGEYCSALGGMKDLLWVNIYEERMNDCPLRIVGR